MSKFERWLHHFFWFVVSVFVAVVDIINYYPNWKPVWMAMYWDWTYISFSCFHFFVCMCLFEIVFYLYNTVEND